MRARLATWRIENYLLIYNKRAYVHTIHIDRHPAYKKPRLRKILILRGRDEGWLQTDSFVLIYNGFWALLMEI